MYYSVGADDFINSDFYDLFLFVSKTHYYQKQSINVRIDIKDLDKI